MRGLPWVPNVIQKAMVIESMDAGVRTGERIAGEEDVD